MITCQRCARRLPASAKYCGRCGVEVRVERAQRVVEIRPRTAAKAPKPSSPVGPLGLAVIILLPAILSIFWGVRTGRPESPSRTAPWPRETVAPFPRIPEPRQDRPFYDSQGSQRNSAPATPRSGWNQPVAPGQPSAPPSQNPTRPAQPGGPQWYQNRTVPAQPGNSQSYQNRAWPGQPVNQPRGPTSPTTPSNPGGAETGRP